VTGQGGDANMEVVLQARPDIIIDVGTVNPSYVDQANRVQEQTGIPYILIDGSFQKSGETYRMLGDLLGEEARAKLLASYADETLAQLAATLESVPADQRPTAYYGRGDEGLETGLSGSINVEILEAAGASNVAAAAGSGGLTDVSLEQILAWNPDVIIAARGSFADAALSNPDWASIKAVSDGAVYVAPPPIASSACAGCSNCSTPMPSISTWWRIPRNSSACSTASTSPMRRWKSCLPELCRRQTDDIGVGR
jgi:iron complex transport system substrate-binding protein